jgi:hypothetical protein
MCIRRYVKSTATPKVTAFSMRLSQEGCYGYFLLIVVYLTYEFRGGEGTYNLFLRFL